MSEKHFHGRDEPIIQPDLPLIDTHHHLYIRPNVQYMLPEFLSDLQAGHQFRASVYVETRYMSRADGPEHLRPVGEIEFANGIGAMGASGIFGHCRFAAAIVGSVDLTRSRSDVEDYLQKAKAAAPERLKGLRQITMDSADPSVFGHLAHPPRQGLLHHPELARNLPLLSEHGLSFDTAVFWHQIPDLIRLVDASPDTQFILNHLGLALAPAGTDPVDVFPLWAAALQELAHRQNVVCKIGGLGSAYWGFGFHEGNTAHSSSRLAEVWRPYIETAILAFGADRCMLESNYPPDGRSAGWVPLWNALKLCLSGASAEEKSKLAHGTAERIYRITY